MNIIYLKQSNDKKLFSFFRHDYQAGENGTFIDGGFDYCRHNGELGQDTIENLIKDIREQFTWTSVYTKDMFPREKPVTKLLKNLDTDHIIGILIYFTKRLTPADTVADAIGDVKQWKAFHLIFLEELKYRWDNNRYTAQI